MPYLGISPTRTDNRKLDTPLQRVGGGVGFNGTTTQFYLTIDSEAVYPDTELLFQAILNGGQLNPKVDFLIQGNIITFAIAPSSSAVFFAILGDRVSLNKPATDSVTTSTIRDAAVTTIKIADGSITADKIADGTIIAADVADGAVTTTKLSGVPGGEAVTTAKIRDLNITTLKIADLAVTTAKIADSNVTTGKIADSNVTTIKIADSNVTTAKIADDAITADKIASGAVGNTELSNSSVSTNKIANDAVTSAQIANGAVGTTELSTGAVTTDKININVVSDPVNPVDGQLVWNTFTNSAKVYNTSAGRWDELLTTSTGGSLIGWELKAAIPSSVSTLQEKSIFPVNNVTYVVTVPNGTAGGFYVDGVQKPSLTLEANSVYTFDQSNASNVNHPFRFSIDNSTIFSGYAGEISVVGTPGSAGAYTRITPNSSYPATIYYRCSNHTGMGGTISISSQIVVKAYSFNNSNTTPRHVVVSTNGKISYSSNLTNWNSSTQVTANNINTVSFGNSFFFAGAESNTLLTSSDGIGWTAASGPFGASGASITASHYANGIALIGGSFGEIASSTGATTFTLRTSNISSVVNSFTYNNGIFLAGGSVGDIISSSDGNSWTQRLNIGGTKKVFLQPYGTGFLAVIDDLNNNNVVIKQSSNGIVWTDLVVNPTNINTVNSFVYSTATQAFLILDNQGFSYRSVDAINWNVFNLPTFELGTTLNSTSISLVNIAGVNTYILFGTKTVSTTSSPYFGVGVFNTTNTQLESNKNYIIDTSYGLLSLYLPVNPNIGDIVRLADGANTWALIPATILSGAKSFLVSTGSIDNTLILDFSGVNIDIVWTGIYWRVY